MEAEMEQMEAGYQSASNQASAQLGGLVGGSINMSKNIVVNEVNNGYVIHVHGMRMSSYIASSKKDVLKIVSDLI